MSDISLCNNPSCGERRYSCRRFLETAGEMQSYLTPSIWNGECNVYYAVVTAEDRRDALNEERIERRREAMS